MRTADDDSVPVPHDAFTLPRAVLTWKNPPRPGVWRPQRDEIEADDTDVTRVEELSHSRARAPSDDLDDEPTRAIQIQTPMLPLPRAPERSAALQALRARAAAHLDPALARAAQLWRDGPLRTAAMVAGAVLLTYLALGGARRGAENRTNTVLTPAAALPAAAPIIVEQLNGPSRPRETAASPSSDEQPDRAARRSSSSRTRVAPSLTTPAPKNAGYQVIAPAQQAKSRSSRTERPSASVSSSSAGLPAWGAEAVRDFSSGKSNTGASASVTSRSQALSGKPSASNADIPPPMAGYKASTREPPKAEAPAAPVVAAKPAEPPKPVEPPRPTKPLTMDQVLNQVEEAAQAQRKKAGLKAPKASKRDEELDALISGAMKSKGK